MFFGIFLLSPILSAPYVCEVFSGQPLETFLFYQQYYYQSNHLLLSLLFELPF